MTAPEPPCWSYWVVPGRFLAGCFPGGRNPDEQEARLRRLVDAGIRYFFNLMEPDECNREGETFADYTARAAELGRERGVEVRCLRFPVRDLDIPTRDVMEEILTAVDAALQEGPVYLHCWGGVGRTGTVAACWLLRHGHCTGEDVLDTLRRLRAMDRERGLRRSPETEAQVRFVREWGRALLPGA